MQIRKCYDNQKGYTLVELLLSIAVLAVVVTPLFTGLLSSQKVSVKAGKVQDATQLGQDILETVKSNSIEELKKEYTTYTEIKNVLTFSFEREGALKNPYQIELVLDPNTYSKEGDSSGVSNINNAELPVLSEDSYDSQKTIWIREMDSDYSEVAAEEIVKEQSPKTLEEVMEKMEKTATINVSNAESDSFSSVCTETFRYLGSDKSYNIDSSMGGSITNNTGLNIYLLYNSLLNGKDKMVFSNNTDVVQNITLVLQENATVLPLNSITLAHNKDSITLDDYLELSPEEQSAYYWNITTNLEGSSGVLETDSKIRLYQVTLKITGEADGKVYFESVSTKEVDYDEE